MIFRTYANEIFVKFIVIVCRVRVIFSDSGAVSVTREHWSVSSQSVSA